MYILFFITKKILKWLFNQYQIKSRGQILQRNLLEIFSLQVVVMTFRLKNKTDRGILVRIRLIHQNCDRIRFLNEESYLVFWLNLLYFWHLKKKFLQYFFLKFFDFEKLLHEFYAIYFNLFQFISRFISLIEFFYFFFDIFNGKNFYFSNLFFIWNNINIWKCHRINNMHMYIDWYYNNRS